MESMKKKKLDEESAAGVMIMPIILSKHIHPSAVRVVYRFS